MPPRPRASRCPSPEALCPGGGREQGAKNRRPSSSSRHVSDIGANCIAAGRRPSRPFNAATTAGLHPDVWAVESGHKASAGGGTGSRPHRKWASGPTTLIAMTAAQHRFDPRTSVGGRRARSVHAARARLSSMTPRRTSAVRCRGVISRHCCFFFTPDPCGHAVSGSSVGNPTSPRQGRWTFCCSGGPRGWSASGRSLSGETS